jgi:enoyl-CoA hydratase/carnithine racemase
MARYDNWKADVLLRNSKFGAIHPFIILRAYESHIFLKYRVATENTLFAMPETAIGLFPDVGSMFWMNRLLKRPVANYLALSGQRIGPKDLLYTGLATHYVPSSQLGAMEKALIEASSKEQPNDGIANGNAVENTDDDIVAGVLMSFHRTQDTKGSFLAQHQDIITQTFNETRVEDIFANLQQQNDNPFCTETLQTLNKVSPTSLKVTLEGLKRGALLTTIGEDLRMEYRMASACRRPGSDFFEGVRAVLVDKDHAPKWNPSTIDAVSEDYVESFFAPVETEWVIPKTRRTSKL